MRIRPWPSSPATRNILRCGAAAARSVQHVVLQKGRAHVCRRAHGPPRPAALGGACREAAAPAACGRQSPQPMRHSRYVSARTLCQAGECTPRTTAPARARTDAYKRKRACTFACTPTHPHTHTHTHRHAHTSTMTRMRTHQAKRKSARGMRAGWLLYIAMRVCLRSGRRLMPSTPLTRRGRR